MIIGREDEVYFSEKLRGKIRSSIKKNILSFHIGEDRVAFKTREKTFDYVILNQSLQQIRHFETVLCEALRVGKKVIVGFPNFAHYKARVQLCFLGKSPVTLSLPYFWYDSPNLHFFSIVDFVRYCHSRKINIENNHFIEKEKTIRFLPNLFADTGIFLISRQDHECTTIRSEVKPK